MKFGFYLSHADFVDLVNEYNIYSAGENKGLVVLIKMTKNPSSGELESRVRFKGVQGPIDGSTQEIPDLTSERKPCPYPPPCQRDAQGNLLIDKTDPDSSCYS